MAGAAIGLTAVPAPAGAQEIFQAAGADPAAIVATVGSFRSALGPRNPNAPGTRFFGRREINWDGVPDAVAAPSELPPDLFNTTSPRGVVFEGAPGFQVSADADNPSGTPVEFGNLHPDYPAQFQPFSPERLFTSLGSPVYDVVFRLPGSDVPGLSRGFGAVFTDVDVPGSTKLEFLDMFGQVLGSHVVPAAPGGLSFLGVIFPPTEHGIARVRITQGSAVPGAQDGAEADAVVADDFIYGEPSINCAGRVPTIVGTTGNDLLLGTGGVEVMAGLEGDDRLHGRGGDDFLCGGAGADDVTGGVGSDFVDGADETTAFLLFERGVDVDGADRLRGDRGDDFLLGLAEGDRMFGGAGGDVLLAEQGDDRLHGQDGTDVLVAAGAPGEPGDDLSRGDAGDDFLLDDGGEDASFGGPGDDVVTAGSGDDFLTGGPGDDRLGVRFVEEGDEPIVILEGGDDTILGGLGDDFLDGGPGRDLLNGQQDSDTCLNGEVLRSCESLGTAALLAAPAGVTRPWPSLRSVGPAR